MLLRGINDMLEREPKKRRGRPLLNSKNTALSPLEKRIPPCLFLSRTDMTSMALSKELREPLSTIQRRRKRLEERFVKVRYSPRFSKLGLRKATLYISAAGIDIPTLGMQILEMSDSVLSATRTIGGNNIDLVVRVIFWTNAGIISLIDEIKQKDGIKGIC